MVAFAAFGGVLTVLGGVIVFPERIDPVAYLAIGVIGSVAGAALGVLGLSIQAIMHRQRQPE